MFYKYLLKPVFFLLCITALGADGKPVIHYDFSKVSAQGQVANAAQDRYHGQISGNYKLLPGGILQFNGKDTILKVSGSEELDVSHNTTFALVYRKNTPPGSSRGDLAMDAFFSKRGSFVMSRLSNNLYSNIHDGKKWNANCQASYVFSAKPDSFHHIALTFAYVNNIQEAEEYVDVTFYFDGKMVKRQRFKDVRIAAKKSLLEIGAASFMGSPWHLGGEICDVRFYNKVLSQNQIRELVLQQTLVTPAFKQGNELPPGMEKKIAALKLTPPQKSAIRNLILAGRKNPSWQTIAANPQKYLKEFKSKESTLTVLDTPGFAHIISWFDRKTNRELLNARTPWVRWVMARNKKQSSTDPFGAGVKSAFSARNDKEFVITYNGKPNGNFPFAFSARSTFRFDNDRLEFNHKAQSKSKDAIIHTTEYPKLSLRPFYSPNEKLFVPSGPGIEQPLPTQKGFRYSHPYPRAFASMQYTAYYDGRTGLFVTPADPRGRMKTISMEGSKNSMDVAFSWQVPYRDPAQPNNFDAQCTAVLQLFRGNWYDAALIYRNVLENIRASWWVRPNRTPQYFSNNCWWLHEAYFGFIEQDFIEVKKYVGIDCCRVDVWSWWEKGHCVHLTPTMRATPEWIEYMRHMRKNGIRAIPYTDGRLWAPLDRRGEDYLYSKYGAPNAVISDGKRITEQYALRCDVICPFTKGYQDVFSEFLIRLGAQGADGIYIDQMGATWQPPCHRAKEHGHLYADWDAWHLNGYAKMLTKVKDTWQKRGWEKFLTTEDNAEIMIGLIDCMSGYRWANDNQVPAYHAVYAGKMQCYTRRAASIDAKIQTLAEQVLFGEQLGPFNTRDFKFPYLTSYRHYAKKLIWLRHALLPFFNQGMMMRPPEFAKPLQPVRRFWGMFGSKFVTKPAVQSAAWKHNDTTAVILINTEATPAANQVIFDAPANSCVLETFSSDGKITTSSRSGSKTKYNFTIPGRSFLVLTAFPAGKRPEKLLQNIAADFKVISQTATAKDPFQVPPRKTALRDPFQPMNLVDSILISGARRNRKEKMVDYNYMTLMDAGLFDFGTKSPSKLQLEVACTRSFTGAVHVYCDEIVPENKIAEIPIPQSFKTANNKTFRYITVPLKKSVTGKKRILFTCDGFFPYNLRSWNVLQQ